MEIVGEIQCPKNGTNFDQIKAMCKCIKKRCLEHHFKLGNDEEQAGNRNTYPRLLLGVIGSQEP